MNKVIKTDLEYEKALTEIETLVDLDPDVGTPEADSLELLTLLVQDYEAKHFSFPLPDPIEAIKFRMEQQNLLQRDLVPYIGSRSKVSEILAGKRPLTLSMIRSLHFGLGIPAQVLLQEREPSDMDAVPIEWDKFPVTEMISRGWIFDSGSELLNKTEKILKDFFNPLVTPLIQAVLYRKTTHVRSERPTDEYSLAAWAARVLQIALENPPKGSFNPENITLDFMRNVVKLSIYENGPLLAKEYLSEHGISMIVEPSLPRTHLDGAAIMSNLEIPVIGLTIRYDRVDNFWFTLMHELSHISLHFGSDVIQFYDDLDLETQDDPREKEADELASEALIPKEEWLKSPARYVKTADAVYHLAKKIGVNPAIVAGRMRFEAKTYRILGNLVGHGYIRKLFTDVTWS